MNKGSSVFVLYYKDIAHKDFFIWIIRDSNNVYVQDTSLCDTIYWQRASLYTYMPVVCSRQQPVGFGFYKLNLQTFNGTSFNR